MIDTEIHVSVSVKNVYHLSLNKAISISNYKFIKCIDRKIGFKFKYIEIIFVNQEILQSSIRIINT